MSKKSQKGSGGRNAPIRRTTWAVKLAVHSVFDDMRRQLAPESGDPHCATVTGMPQSGRSAIVASYVLNHVVDDIIARGLYPAGTDRKEIERTQTVAVDICVPEVLASKALAVNALSRPAEFLRRACTSLMQRGTTELLLLEGFDELLQRAQDQRGAAVALEIAIAHQAVTALARTVETPVVHVGGPNFRNLLSRAADFRQIWRWEVDVFNIGPDLRANTEYMLARFRDLRIVNVEVGPRPAAARQ
ncbi:hypothetical protein GCM10007881_61730 [Mesorhizobium huakuii]|nr:hypothetical protein GCM10007881_61730 [Mesorhizobium huakuii]